MYSTNTFKPFSDCKLRGPCSHPKPTLYILIPTNAMVLSQARPRSPSPNHQPLNINAATPSPPSFDYSYASWDDELAPGIALRDARYTQALKLARARSAWEQECQMRWCRFIRSPLPSIFPRDAAWFAASCSASRPRQTDSQWILAGSTPVIGPDGLVVTPIAAPAQGKSNAGRSSGAGSTGSDSDDGGCLFGCYNPLYPGCFKCG
ncbi:uncharacterized protein J3D65DRAFT_639069 [Phyllosticta citribraziliensis]|uniref:Uncharacterized protein n=1 Tax=Phyllosticta citribraziliensis TaxID=989973 RepID=A0ABR1L5Z3_9PEZI